MVEDPIYSKEAAVSRAKAAVAGAWGGVSSAICYIFCYGACTALFGKDAKQKKLRHEQRMQRPPPAPTAHVGQVGIGAAAGIGGPSWTGPCGKVNPESARFCTGCGTKR